MGFAALGTFAPLGRVVPLKACAAQGPTVPPQDFLWPVARVAAVQDTWDWPPRFVQRQPATAFARVGRMALQGLPPLPAVGSAWGGALASTSPYAPPPSVTVRAILAFTAPPGPARHTEPMPRG